MDSYISATPIADRYVKSSTQPCNIHRFRLAVEWAVLKRSVTQCSTVIGYHLCNKSVHQISALLELPWSTVSAVIVKWKRLGATIAQPQSGSPHKLTERDLRVLKHVAWKNHPSLVATLTTASGSTEFQTASGSKVNTSTIRRELHEMGFHG